MAAGRGKEEVGLVYRRMSRRVKEKTVSSAPPNTAECPMKCWLFVWLQEGKINLERQGKPTDMAVLSSLKRKLWDAGRFYFEVHRCNIKVLTAVFITWSAPGTRRSLARGLENTIIFKKFHPALPP